MLLTNAEPLRLVIPLKFQMEHKAEKTEKFLFIAKK